MVSDKGRAVDLLDEEASGGPTIARHVGKSEAFLLNRIQTARTQAGFFTIGLKRAGTFPSIESAEKLVNSTISENAAIVDRVATGQLTSYFLTKEFASKTGIEAFARNDRDTPIIRSTNGVGVFIVHDQSSSRGYRVLTAYPRSPE